MIRSLLRLLLGRRLPVTSGNLPVPGLAAPVAVRRDRFGIPMIEAESERDALFALGFCHAQDRAGQLEVLLRLGRGTVAEMAGEKAVGVDRISRRVGFRHAANQQWPVLTENARTILTAYTDGINAGYRHGLRRRPHEFVFLRRQPTPWEPQDVLAYTKIQSWFMASNWDCELARLRILLADGPDALRALDPLAFDNTGLTAETIGATTGGLTALDRLEADIALLQEILPLGGGSNNWVIGPKRSATGRPILCNDPHLGAQVPAPWYLVSIRTPGWAIAGASFVGSPAIPCGHNGTAAWGVTAGLTDNTDLFLEQLVPGDEEDKWTYRDSIGLFRPCGARTESIRVKGGETVEEVVLTTSRGPIISPGLDDVPEAISLRGVWLDPLPLNGWLSAMKATSFGEFRDAFQHWPGFPMNLVYADVSGTIGWQLVGQVPKRKRGNGTVPLAGWDERNGWDGLVPFGEMPFVQDPPEGFVATANNRPRLETEGPFLGADFLDRYRHEVIVQALAGREKWDVAGAASIQQSVRSVPWEEAREAILAIRDDRPGVQRALAALQTWDGHVTADSGAAAIWEVFLAKMAVSVAAAKAPKAWAWAAGRGASTLAGHSFFAFRRLAHLVDLIRSQPDGWFPSGWPTAMANALDESALWLERVAGTQFTWGTARPLVLFHQLMGPTPVGSAFNLGPFPVGGDEHTPNHASPLPLDPLGPVKAIPNLRATIDVGQWSASRFVLAGGQSGNPMSPHYADLLPFWLRGEGVPIAFTASEVQAATVQVLRLEPSRPS